MLLKKYPEDFIVNELFSRNLLKEGKYSIFVLKKKDYNTEGAVSEVAKIFNLDRKRISYAGLKDRRAITTQHISILNCGPNKVFNHENISLEFKGYSNSPISLGDLDGNKFVITVRELKNPVIKEKNVPNYFDDQRFGSFNHLIGKHLVNSEFKEAANLIIESDYSKKRYLEDVLMKNPNDFVNAIRQIQPKMLKLYVHAYQSYLWNKTVKSYLEKYPDATQRKIPIIGFGMDVEDDLKEILENIMFEEKLTPRSFIIRQIPNLSVEGTNRELFIDYKDLTYKIEQDEDKEHKKVIFEFFLPKGSYATMLVKNLLENGSSGI
jgi:tRNA pseudouridine13 synthase